MCFLIKKCCILFIGIGHFISVLMYLLHSNRKEKNPSTRKKDEQMGIEWRSPPMREVISAVFGCLCVCILLGHGKQELECKSNLGQRVTF